MIRKTACIFLIDAIFYQVVKKLGYNLAILSRIIFSERFGKMIFRRGEFLLNRMTEIQRGLVMGESDRKYLNNKDR